ncbi:RnfH family protein, partial [Escherichia coli]|nr:RnfH family protein [Escherichia coli]
MTKIWVEVTYALPDKQYLIPVELTLGDTVEQAIIASNILTIC